MTIICYSNSLAHLPADTSALFLRTLSGFLSTFWGKEIGAPVLYEEIRDAIALTGHGQLVQAKLLG